MRAGSSGMIADEESRRRAGNSGGMPLKTVLGCVLAIVASSAWAAQAPPPTFPAQQRGPGDPQLVARGLSLYSSFCRACHGADLRGGDMGGPNLLRSQLVLNDKAGEAIGPVVRAGRVP